MPRRRRRAKRPRGRMRRRSGSGADRRGISSTSDHGFLSSSAMKSCLSSQRSVAGAARSCGAMTLSHCGTRYGNCRNLSVAACFVGPRRRARTTRTTRRDHRGASRLARDATGDDECQSLRFGSSTQDAARCVRACMHDGTRLVPGGDRRATPVHDAPAMSEPTPLQTLVHLEHGVGE
jgi:hypothetical protein